MLSSAIKKIIMKPMKTQTTGCPTKKFIFKIFVTQKLVKIKQ